MHADTNHRRISHQHWPVGLYLLLLRSPDGGSRASGVRTAGDDRWMDDHVHGGVQLCRRRDYG